MSLRRARALHGGPFRVAFALALAATGLASGSSSSAQDDRALGRIARWPCRLIVKPTLLGVMEDGWERSPTLRRQCRELADAGSVVVLEWTTTLDSQSRASTRIGTDRTGTVVAMVSVPPVSRAIELLAHELEHVLERTRGVDLAAESRRPGSGVWKAFGGFETQRAIDVGRRVASEVEESRRKR
jgi:hypothetical protein